jgi:hypothetical protein
MFRNSQQESVDRFYAVVEKYGYGEVRAADLYEMFDGIASPGTTGFSMIKAGYYVRAVSPEITHVIKLQALKGYAYSVWWGVSLSYLPEVQQNRLRWHRTLKSAKLDLFEEPSEYFNLIEKDRDTAAKHFAYNGHGPQYLRETMSEMWSTVAHPIRIWFDGTMDLVGVLREADRQSAHRWRGPLHIPSAQLVRAFTLSRIGHHEQATSALEDYLSAADVSPADAKLFRDALNKL